MDVKINEKSIKKWIQDREGLLEPILSGFEWIWEAKLSPSWEPREAKTSQDKGRQGKRREGKGKEEEGKGLQGKGVEKYRGGPFASGGGGVHPTLRGRPPQDPKPGGSRGVGDSYCDFFGTLVALLFRIVFRCLFGSILAPVSLPTCFPKSIKIQEKSMPRCHPSWILFFNRFLVGFGSQLGPI